MPAVNSQTLSSLMDGTQVPESSFESFMQPYYRTHGINPFGKIMGGNDSTTWADKQAEFSNRWHNITFQPGNPYYKNGTPEEVASFEANKRSQLNALRNDMNSFFNMNSTSGYGDDAARLQNDVERYGSTGMTNQQLSPLINQVNTLSPNNNWNNFYGRTIPKSEIPGMFGTKPTPQTNYNNIGAGQVSPIDYNSMTPRSFSGSYPAQTNTPRAYQSSTNRKRRWYEAFPF